MELVQDAYRFGAKRRFTATKPDPADGRRLLVALTEDGAALYERAAPIAARITEETLAPLNERERAAFIGLLGRLT